MCCKTNMATQQGKHAKFPPRGFYVRMNWNLNTSGWSLNEVVPGASLVQAIQCLASSSWQQMCSRLSQCLWSDAIGTLELLSPALLSWLHFTLASDLPHEEAGMLLFQPLQQNEDSEWYGEIIKNLFLVAQDDDVRKLSGTRMCIFLVHADAAHTSLEHSAGYCKTFKTWYFTSVCQITLT